MGYKVNDITVRAVKTFLQAFLAAWALSNYDVSKGAVIGAVAAGISAIVNSIVVALK